MAIHRALSFPLSRVEEVARESPFKVQEADAARLSSCDAFHIIRKLLAKQQDSDFCQYHLPMSREDKEAWLLQRDITHALVLPILEIFRHASDVAKSMLGNRNIYDLELVFRGEARGAFSWLQCFIAEEEDWCRTKGCPACVVSKVLEAEPTIRIVLVACRLSESLRQPHNNANLPVLHFWLASLRNALNEDPFWGPDFRSHLESRAEILETGIQNLAKQCLELEELLKRESNTSNAAAVALVKAQRYAPTKPTKLRISRLAERQIALAKEENSWMQKIIVGCWTTLLADAAEARRKSSLSQDHLRPSKARHLTS
ncbi:MAG: hypothetical protein Q9191_002834 [Dirinaria sp. TL-2023a]